MTEQRSGNTLFDWWYSITLPQLGGALDPSQREAIRKSRLLSMIVFFLFIIFVAFIPACLVLPNHFVLVADLSMMPICLIALLLNRNQYPLLAGGFLMLSFEAALIMVILTTIPFDEPSIQQYELFVFGELLAVSLLHPRSVFVVAAFNSIFIAVSLRYQPHTSILNQDLQTQFLPIMIRPVAIQFLVAGVTYLWVEGATTFMRRAYQAEKEATEAQKAAEQQKEKEARERKSLQEGIELVLHNHAAAMNQGMISKIPLENEYAVLWPLINVVNSLQNRLQHTHQIENEKHRLEEAISQLTEMAYQGTFSLEQPVQTRTSLDLFLKALREQSSCGVHLPMQTFQADASHDRGN